MMSELRRLLFVHWTRLTFLGSRSSLNLAILGLKHGGLTHFPPLFVNLFSSLTCSSSCKCFLYFMCAYLKDIMQVVLFWICISICITFNCCLFFCWLLWLLECKVVIDHLDAKLVTFSFWEAISFSFTTMETLHL